MHIADLSAGNLGANGIVGGGIPIAVGAALSTKMQGIDRIVLCFFGDGACNEGTFHEAANLASIWKLPIIFYCINNHYGMSMSVERHMNIDDISIRSKSYGFEGETIDGNDVLEVRRAVRAAREHVLKDGPYLIAATTYRIMGHSKSDPNVYRTKEEINQWREKCPIKNYRKWLLENAVCSEAEVEEIDAKAKESIEAAYQWAEQQPDPALETALEDVWAE
jgi:TPP-dependent pyruvate/acetoin dehydrogenase alpha subunit